jgi:hypothetical protein
VVRELQQQKGENWNVRIGIHTGKLCAGLLGRNKFIYDVFGDTVNLASRLADAAEVDHVNVSEDVKNMCNGRESFYFRGEVSLKGKGVQRCYYLSTHGTDSLSSMGEAASQLAVYSNDPAQEECSQLETLPTNTLALPLEPTGFTARTTSHISMSTTIFHASTSLGQPSHVQSDICGLSLGQR